MKLLVNIFLLLCISLFSACVSMGENKQLNTFQDDHATQETEQTHIVTTHEEIVAIIVEYLSHSQDFISMQRLNVRGILNNVRRPADLRRFENILNSLLTDIMTSVPQETAIIIYNVDAPGFDNSVLDRMKQITLVNLARMNYKPYVPTRVREHLFENGVPVDTVFSDREIITLGIDAGIERRISVILEGGGGLPYTLYLELVNTQTGQKRTTMGRI